MGCRFTKPDINIDIVINMCFSLNPTDENVFNDTENKIIDGKIKFLSPPSSPI